MDPLTFQLSRDVEAVGSPLAKREGEKEREKKKERAGVP
jgi:hypothetical protein